MIRTLTYLSLGLLMLSYWPDSYAQAPSQSPMQIEAQSLTELMEQRLKGIAESAKPRLRNEAIFAPGTLRDFYTARGFRPIWINSADGRARSIWLLASIREAEDDGLLPQDYHFMEISNLYRSNGQNPDELMDLELLMTDAHFLLASHLYFGKTNPESIKAEWNIKRTKAEINLAERLAQDLANNALWQSLDFYRPSMSAYAALRQKLRFYRLRLITLPWEPLPFERKLEAGDSHAHMHTIRQRLIALGDLAAYQVSDSLHYDENLLAGLKRFQRRHGLHPDGVIGPNTLSAINSTPAERMQSTLANLERLRWLPDDMADERVEVNIASFEMHYVNGLDTLISSRAVVGRPYRRSPVFYAEMDHIVFSPTWTVPPGIMRNDVLPAVRKNQGYLAEKNMVVLDSHGRAVNPSQVDWFKSPFPYTIRQNPGPQNALGQAKFMFPNSYAVYIHDTPSRELFDREERAFSSGCIRISKPREFAEVLLRDREEWDSDKIRAAMQSNREQRVNLRSKVPVYLLYFTAWASEEGVHFRKDIYNRDAPLLQALQTPRPSY